MYYLLTVRDFLDRAAHEYPDRVAVVDEPEQPGASLGELTCRQLAALAVTDGSGVTAEGFATAGVMGWGCPS